MSLDEILWTVYDRGHNSGLEAEVQDDQPTIDHAKTALNQYMKDSFLELIKSGLPARIVFGEQTKLTPSELRGFNQAIDQAENQLRRAAEEKFQ